MIPIVKWTLWQRRWSTVWWSIGMLFLIFFSMIFYPSFKNDAEQLQKSFENLPDAAVQLFGGSTDFFSPVGFLNSQIFFLTLPLILSVLAIGMGCNLIGKEVQNLTIESLLARPISRSKLLLGKATAGALILFGVTLISLITTVVTAKIVDLEVGIGLISLATLACFLLVLSFGAIAFMLSCYGKTRNASLGITAFIAFGGYIIGSLAGTVDWLEIPSKIFPFTYYQPEAILRETFNWANIMFFISVIIGCGLISWLSFRHRDIT
ncbi:MAG TPA: ABC transporter permease subunit [Patescibacteria group bacterium]|nr:ABC transporter permease subunit [Patescibacteria group bacterium]